MDETSSKMREVATFNEYPIGVSGILRCRNCDDFLDECIESVIDGLDELVAVYNECTDRTVEILERKQRQYPDKIKLYEYLPHVLPLELDEETFAYARSLPPGSGQLMAEYTNFVLSKATYRYIMKVDADQVYFTPQWKRICDAYRTTDKVTITEQEEQAYRLYADRKLPAGQYPYYASYIEKRIINDKVAVSFSGINLYHPKECWMVGLGDRTCRALQPPFNGAHDHFCLDAGKGLRYESRIRPTLIKGGYGRIIERMRYGEEMLDGGFLWFHLKALTKAAWNESIPLSRLAPLERLVNMPYPRFNAQYRPYFATHFAESGFACLFEAQRSYIPWQRLDALEEKYKRMQRPSGKYVENPGNRTLCFIPVRKGSKGIPGKNLKLLGGKPLVCWVLDTVLASGIADEVWVATDWDEMERLVCDRYAEKVKVYRRSEWSARDEAPTPEVVREFLEEVRPDDNDRFILLQATSPFLRREELQALLGEMRKGEYDSFVSCCRLKKFRWSGDGRPLDYTAVRKPRRQEFEGMLLESGAFYASTAGAVRRSGELLPGCVRVMETGEGGLIDLDEYSDWRRAEDYARKVGVTDDFYVEYYETVDELLQAYVFCKELEQPVCTYLFQRSYPLRPEYEKRRKGGYSANRCRKWLEERLLPNIPEKRVSGRQASDDYRSESWYETLSALSGRLVTYVYNNRQLRYLLPLVNGLNRPVLLVCEPGVDEEVEVGEHVTAVELCFMDACPVYEDNVLETGFPELYRYYNTFFLMTEALRPEGVVVLEGCHYQEQVWGVIARKRGIPCIGIQQGWPSLMHTMFRNLPYSHYLTWGRNLSEYWKKYNPGTDFISTGYLYEVERKRGDDITFFLQAPVFISDAAYFDQLVELVVETAERYPERTVGVREHPEYNLPASVVEKLGNYPNVRMMSDCTLVEAFAHTSVAVSHFSSALLEGVAHDCVPLVFDPARDSRYTPDVEQLGLGLIAYDKQSFFEKLEVILTDSSTFLEKILMRKEGWMQAVSGEAVKHAVDALTRIAPCRIPETTTVPKLHIGCGPFTLEGWLNTDIGGYRPEIRYLDAGRHYPFPDDSFEYIYSEHLFEHLELPQAATLLEECFRVLKPGGRMRLAMPDFHFLMELYRHPDEEPNRRYLAWSYRLFGEKKWGEVAEEDYPVHVINNFFHLWGHRFIHTPEHLTRMAERAGFEQFCRYPVGASDTPVFRNIERHRDSIPEWANELETFVVEMEKPIHPKEGKKEETAGIVPAVSVIVPVYNGEKYLECCLESLSGQSLENVEVVLVNDGSTDASGQMMKEYAAGHARCRYVEQENGGLSAARNAGLEHATGRYVAFLDCDDFLPQEALAKLYEKAVETDADIVAGNVAVFENGFTYDYHRRNADGGEVVSGVTFLSRVTDERRYVPMVYGYLYERAFIEKNRLRFEPGIIHEDELWTPIALAKAARVAAVGNVTCYYRQHGISIMKTACAEKRLASMACIIDKLMEFLRQGRLPEKGLQAIRARIGLLERMMGGLRMNKQ